jgi:hypothetical protein
MPLPQAMVDVRHRLTLQPHDGCFVLFVEAAVPLFALALQVCCDGAPGQSSHFCRLHMLSDVRQVAAFMISVCWLRLLLLVL